jgi:hypothetical protein
VPRRTRSPRSPFAADVSAAEFVVLAEPDRRPVRGAETTLVRVEGGVDRATTNDVGAARFAPSAGAAQLVVRAERRPPVVFNVGAAAGRTELTLPAGATLRGRVTIDGATPTRPVALTAHGLAAAGSRSWGAATLAAVGGAERPNAVELDTDAEGRFEIGGLERTIGAPAYVRVRNAALDVEPRLQKASGLYGHAALTALDGEFVLPLLTAPRMRGRLRAHDGPRRRSERGWSCKPDGIRTRRPDCVSPTAVRRPANSRPTGGSTSRCRGDRKEPDRRS